MTHTVLISYRWDDREESRWLFWLKQQLERRGFAVSLSPLPEMPGSDSAWIKGIQATHRIAPEKTYFVRHDPGCLTIIRYLESLARHQKSEPALLIAGFPKRKTRSPKAASEPAARYPFYKKLPLESAVAAKPASEIAHAGESQTDNLDIRLVIAYSGVIEELPRRAPEKLLTSTPRTNFRNGKPKPGFLRRLFLRS